MLAVGGPDTAVPGREKIAHRQPEKVAGKKLSKKEKRKLRKEQRENNLVQLAYEPKDTYKGNSFRVHPDGTLERMNSRDIYNGYFNW